MPSLRIVALSVIILGSLACSEEQSTTTTVTTGADVCVDDATYFAQTLWPGVLQNKCLGCHNAQGIARETEFVLQPAAQPGYMETNQEIVTYLSSLERDGTSFILLKPTEAVPHGGGLVLSEGSAEYNMLAQFAERAREPVVCDTEPTVTTDPLAGVTMMSYPRTLRKAMLALGGRLPTADEFDTVDRLGATGVSIAVIGRATERCADPQVGPLYVLLIVYYTAFYSVIFELVKHQNIELSVHGARNPTAVAIVGSSAVVVLAVFGSLFSHLLQEGQHMAQFFL